MLHEWLLYTLSTHGGLSALMFSRLVLNDDSDFEANKNKHAAPARRATLSKLSDFYLATRTKRDTQAAIPLIHYTSLLDLQLGRLRFCGVWQFKHALWNYKQKASIPRFRVALRS
jgi:hypothetical protein